MPRRAPTLVPIVLAAAAALAAPGHACDMNVREAGFITQAGFPYAPRPYMLWYVCSKPTPEDRTYAERTEALCRERGLNLSVTLIDTSRLSAGMLKTLRDQGVSTDALPTSAVVRVGGEMGAFLIQPGRLDENAIRALGMSPKKREMKKLLSRESNYCVLLFIPGGNAQADAAALGRLRAAAEAHTRAKPRQAMPILELDRANPAESFLLAELGVTPGGPGPGSGAGANERHFDGFWIVPAAVTLALALAAFALRGRRRLAAIAVGGALLLLGVGLWSALSSDERGPAGDGAAESVAAIVFGKGRLLLPVFHGDGVREEALAERFAFLNYNASDCGENPVFVNDETRDLLLRWEEALDRSIIRQIVAAGTVPELLETLRRTGWTEVSFDEAGNPIEPLDPGQGTGPAPAPPLRSDPAKASAPPWAYVVPAVALVLLAVASLGAIALRRKRPD